MKERFGVVRHVAYKGQLKTEEIFTYEGTLKEKTQQHMLFNKPKTKDKSSKAENCK